MVDRASSNSSVSAVEVGLGALKLRGNGLIGRTLVWVYTDRERGSSSEEGGVDSLKEGSCARPTLREDVIVGGLPQGDRLLLRYRGLGLIGIVRGVDCRMGVWGGGSPK